MAISMKIPSALSRELPAAIDNSVIVVALLVFAEWIVSTAFLILCFRKEWLNTGERQKKHVTLAAGLICGFGKMLFVAILVLALQQIHRGRDNRANMRIQTDWAYLLHIYLNAQCFLLVIQSVLCLRQVLRRFRMSSPKSTPGQKPSDPISKSFCDLEDPPHVIIIIPCYHEDPKTLEITLNSVAGNNYPRSKLHTYLSFDGLNQTEEIESVKNLFGLANLYENDAEQESGYETDFYGYRLTFSVFQHGGKRNCQKRTFEQVKLREKVSSLNRSYILLLDSDTFLQQHCIENFVMNMENQSAEGTRYHALSGITRVFEPRQSLLCLFQQVEYFYSQNLEREAEASCGAVHCLPGGLIMFTYTMLEAVADEYFKDTDVAHENCFDYMKKYLGEDRWLTQLASKQDRGRGGIGFCRTSVCETVAPATTASFLNQRKRWFLGCMTNEVSGMSDPDSWKHYPMLSAFRLGRYAVGCPGFPFVLTRFNILKQTPYFWPNLTIWAAAVAITWVTLIITAGRDDLSSALSYPIFFLINPVQSVITRLYAISTIRHRTWGARTAPLVSRTFSVFPKKSPNTRTRLLNSTNTKSFVAELKVYLDQSHPNCAAQVIKILGTGSQVGEVTCVLSDGITVARKRALSRSSSAGRAILHEISILSLLSHVHIISIVKAQELSPNPEIFLWPVAPCDLKVFLSSFHKADNGGSIDQDIWQALGLISATQASSSLSNARKWLSKSIGCLCNSVAYLHNEGIRHHDLRTRNILVTSRGPVLADFGQALDIGKPQSPATVSSHERKKEFAADVLLLGCVLLEISSAVVDINPRANEHLNVMTDFSRTYEWNFVTNAEKRTRWIEAMYRCSHSTMVGVLDLVQQMFKDGAARRLSASSVVQKLSVLDMSSVLFGECCAHQV